MDMGKNTIFGFTETWLKMKDDIRFSEPRSENFQCFRKDRNLSLHDKLSGDGLLLYIPRSFKLKNVQILPQSPNLVSKASG